MCDQLDSKQNQIKQLGEHEGNVISGFAYFCNEKIIDRKGWVSVESGDLHKAFDQAKQKLDSGELYYGSI